MITRPIPDEAMPVVEVLRRDVPRPELPVIYCGTSPRWIRYSCVFCAMGLHPLAKYRMPTSPEGFGNPCDDDAVCSFADWHDEQTDPQALVDAIWTEGGA